MAIHNFENRIASTIRELSDPLSYKSVCHQHRIGEPMPSIINITKVIDLVREILFPGYFGNTSLRPDTTRHYMGVYVDELYEILCNEILAGLCFECTDTNTNIIKKHRELSQKYALEFIESLPEIRRKLVKDVESIFVNDPAAKNVGEVIFAYPAVRAITNYRIANKLLKLNVPIIPRFISEMAHSETGIDIHPKAEIGEKFTIDHGTGVVIGSTCILGNNVKIYQGVTLGAKSFPLDEEGNPIKGIPRHPIVEDDVVIYSGATILGRITIGQGSVIGGNVWITKSLPAYSKVSQSQPRETIFTNGGGI